MKKRKQIPFDPVAVRAEIVAAVKEADRILAERASSNVSAIKSSPVSSHKKTGNKGGWYDR